MNDSSRGMGWAVLVSVAVGLWLGMCGCKQTAAEQASESDANGYACLEGHKFYTDRKVFADQCPVCQSVKITEVYGYVCEVNPAIKPPGWTPGCGQVTLAPRGGPVRCSKCGRAVATVMLPRAATLARWGATKASREQVQLH